MLYKYIFYKMNKTINDESIDESCWWHQHGKDYFYTYLMCWCVHLFSCYIWGHNKLYDKNSIMPFSNNLSYQYGLKLVY